MRITQRADDPHGTDAADISVCIHHQSMPSRRGLCWLAAVVPATRRAHRKYVEPIRKYYAKCSETKQPHLPRL